MYALINQLTLLQMQLIVLDDLAEAMKALDGKNIAAPPTQLTVNRK